MTQSRKSFQKRPAGTLQAMGGKEERTSEVGRARAEAERREMEGEVRYDIAPGPGPGELLHSRRRRSTPGDEGRLPQKQVSPRPRGGPSGLEPEDVRIVPARRKPRRRAQERLRFEHDDSEG